MDGARTRGQPAALGAVRAMLRSGVPHAILLTGPAGVGKTTLALDLAAALLCVHPDAAARPCRACRACRMQEAGNHPDLHRLAPSGAGAQIGIGGTERSRGVRDLIAELVLMPVEGGARVAVIEEAQRLNEDAQSALLKTLEEPAAGVVLILCAEEEERLLPTVRSRCARIRLGPVGVREIEDLLGELGLAEPPLAGRLARIAAGRPGIAMAYARAPQAEAIRGELCRRLLDLRAEGTAAGLAAIRELQARAIDLAKTLEAAALLGGTVSASGRKTAKGRTGRGSKAGSKGAAVEAGAGPDTGAGGLDGSDEGAPDDAPADGEAGGTKLAAAERRRGAVVLVRIWQDLARDMALVALGERRLVRDPGLLDDLEAAVTREGTAPGQRHHASGAGGPAAFLARLSRAAELLEGNVAPELVLDTLVVAWPAGVGAEVSE